MNHTPLIEMNRFVGRPRELLLCEEYFTTQVPPPPLLWSLALLPLDRFEHVLLYAGAVAASVTVRGSLSSAATRRHRDELGEDLYRFALFHAPLIAAPNAACAFDTQADLTRATVLSAGATLATSYALPFPGRLARRIETKVGALVPVPTPRIDLPGVERLLERLLKQLESSWHQRMVRVSAPGL